MAERHAQPPRHHRPGRRPMPALIAVLAACLLASAASPALAQRGRRANFELSKAGESVKAAFREVVAPASRGTVLIQCEGKTACFGTVVAANGSERLIATKASELSGDVACVPYGGSAMPATIVAVAEEDDLALLKVTAKDPRSLRPVTWGDASKAEIGQWVASVAPTETPAAVGVLSVGRRKIPGHNGLLGVLLSDAAEGGDGADGSKVTKGAKVAQVVPESPAEKAGLQVDDVITRLNETAVESREALISTVRHFMPGQEVKLTVLRGGTVIEVKAKLAGAIGSTSRSETMNRMGGALSNRNAGFPAVLQHDTVLTPIQCGGPLVTLDGKAIGLNIARAGRVESYALPADVIEAVVKDYRAGRLATPETQPSTPATSPSTRPIASAGAGRSEKSDGEDRN